MKTYTVTLQMELTPDEGCQQVKNILIRGLAHDQMPLELWCDFMERLGRMTPEGDMAVCGGVRGSVTTSSGGVVGYGSGTKEEKEG